MTIERARSNVVDKPWGVSDLRPWSDERRDGAPIGEIWFQRADIDAPEPTLLLKLLFTAEPLSIQVHPDDDVARSMGLKNGKTEVWYILAAKKGAQVALGLKSALTPRQLREAIADGSISDLVHWRDVANGEVVFVPAGTIHAIGGGLVIAEIQQRSDATFRMFDYGRKRELHMENALTAAVVAPSKVQSAPVRLTDARTLLIENSHFILERITLAPMTNWTLRAERETWLLVLDGHARVGSMNALVGEAVYMENDTVPVRVGLSGLTALVAYLGPKARADLLNERGLKRPGRETLGMFQPSVSEPPRASKASAPERRA